MRPRPRKSQVWTVQSQVLKDSELKPKIYKWDNLWIVETLKAYCQSTGLHGFNFITRSDTSHQEKIGWIVVVVIAMIVSIVLLVISWKWNSVTPTVTVIESTHFATWNVPFPAVTVCNFNKVSKRRAMNLATEMKRPKNVTANQLAHLFLLVTAFNEKVNVQKEDYLQLGAILDSNNVNSIMLQEMLSPTCNDMVLRCTWKGTLTRCDTLFQQVNSTEGPCCSFNYHGMTTNNYVVNSAYTIPRLPRRVTASGHQTGLTVVLDPMVDDYFGTYLSGYGFRVLIHDSYDYPGTNSETKIVSAQTENFISITPESTYATEDVESLHPRRRGCLFRKEMKLEVMQSYSYVNCLAECRGKLFYGACGCMPTGTLNNGSFPSCKIERIECVLEHMNSFHSALPGLNQTNELDGSNVKLPCDCLPDCELNQYPAEIATGILNRAHSYNAMNLFKDLVLSNKVIIHAYFNDLVSSRYRKDIFQNWIGMLASFGGLLGLLIGFSIVTAFEFLYYLTLRPLFGYLTEEIMKRQNKINVDEFDSSKGSSH